MAKHAYLIMAHGNYDQLAFLVERLDHPQNDIFIHIDLKSSLTVDDQELIYLKAKQSQIIFVPRVAVYWGGYSQIAAEFSLFKAARQENNYAFYHLLSGIDLPLQSQDYIHHFFDRHADNIFLTMMTLEGDQENIDRIKYYHWFERWTPRSLPGILGKGFFKLYRKSEVLIQKIIGIDRLKKECLEPIKAAQWCSLPADILDLILTEEEEVERLFKRSFLADEVFLPYLLTKHGLVNRLYNGNLSQDRKEDFQGNLRYINWWDGNPYTWTDAPKDIDSLEEARQAGYLFSRKFDLQAYPHTRDKILEWTD